MTNANLPTARPTHAIYIELCRMSGRGLTDTPEYRALNAAYHSALDREIREQPPRRVDWGAEWERDAATKGYPR